MTTTTDTQAAECALFEAWVRSIWDLGATDDPLELQGRLLDAWKARAALEAQAGATEPKPVDWSDPRAWLVTAVMSPGPKTEPATLAAAFDREAFAQAKPAPSQQQAFDALDTLDDFARMDVGADAYGPRGVLERFIAAAPAAPAPLTDEQIKRTWEAHRAALPRYYCFARAIERAHGIGAASKGGGKP